MRIVSQISPLSVHSGVQAQTETALSAPRSLFLCRTCQKPILSAVVYPLLFLGLEFQCGNCVCPTCFGQGVVDDYQDFGDTVVYAGSYSCPDCGDDGQIHVNEKGKIA